MHLLVLVEIESVVRGSGDEDGDRPLGGSVQLLSEERMQIRPAADAFVAEVVRSPSCTLGFLSSSRASDSVRRARLLLQYAGPWRWVESWASFLPSLSCPRLGRCAYIVSPCAGNEYPLGKGPLDLPRAWQALEECDSGPFSFRNTIVLARSRECTTCPELTLQLPPWDGIDNGAQMRAISRYVLRLLEAEPRVLSAYLRDVPCETCGLAEQDGRHEDQVAGAH